MNKTNVLKVPRERYVLFLIRDARTGLPTMAGVPRYGVIAGAEGKFLLENGTVQVITKTPRAVQNEYKGSTIDAFETAIIGAVGK